MQIVIWLMFSFGVAFVLRSRLVVLAGVALTVWTLVPAVASPILIGDLPGSFAYRAGTWFILIAFVVQVVTEPRPLLEELGRRFPTYLCMGLVVSEAVLVARLSNDRGGVVIVVDQMIAPILLFLIIGAGAGSGRGSVEVIKNWIVALATVEALFAVGQFLAGSPLVYRRYYETLSFFTRATNTRWMGTTDHPLTLSLLLCAGVPLLAGLRRVSIQLPLLALMAAGVLITQSRTGLVAFAVGAVYVVIASQMQLWAKFVTLALMAASAYYATGSALASGVQGRLADDTGSTLARSLALNFFLSHWREYVISGNGISSSYQVSKLGGLQTSLESSVLMYGVGIGIVFTILYFGTQLMLVIRSAFARTPRGAAVSGLMLVVIPQTFSALATESMAGPLLWVGLAVVVADARDRAASHPTPAVDAFEVLAASSGNGPHEVEPVTSVRSMMSPDRTGVPAARS